MDETTIKCDNCEEEFTDEESYESHRELSHENDSFQFIDSRDAVDEQEFVRINGKREYNPNPNAGLYDNKLFREGSAKERTSMLGEHHDGTDHEHPHEEKATEVRHLSSKQKSLIKNWVNDNRDSLSVFVTQEDLPYELLQEIESNRDYETLYSDISRYASDVVNGSESKATEGYVVFDSYDNTVERHEDLNDAKQQADSVNGYVSKELGDGSLDYPPVYRAGEAKATERQPSDGNDYWKNTYILPTGDDAYARCTICGADVDTLTTDGDWMSDKEMLDHYDDHVSRGQIMLYGESLDEEQSEDYLEARDELIAGAIGSEKLGSKNPFKIGNESYANEDEDQRDQSELETDTSYEDEIYGGNSGNPDNWYKTEDGEWEVVGDGESYAKEYNQEIDPSDEEEVFQILEDEGANYTTGIDQLVYVIQRHTHYDNEDATKLAEKWQSIRLGRESVNEVDCPKCSGNGIIGNKMCSYCNGEGQVSEIEALKSEYGSDEWVDHYSPESYAKEDDYKYDFDELSSLAQDKIEDGHISRLEWDNSSKEERKDLESVLHGDESDEDGTMLHGSGWNSSAETDEDVDYEKEDELSVGFIEQQHTEPKEDKNKDLDDVDISLESIDYIYPTKVGEAKKKSYITEAIDGLDEEYDHEKESDSEEIVEMVTSRKMSGYSDESIARELHITYGVDPDYARNRVYGIEVSTNDKVANTFFGKMYKDCTESEKDELKMYSGSDY